MTNESRADRRFRNLLSLFPQPGAEIMLAPVMRELEATPAGENCVVTVSAFGPGNVKAVRVHRSSTFRYGEPELLWNAQQDGGTSALFGAPIRLLDFPQLGKWIMYHISLHTDHQNASMDLKHQFLNGYIGVTGRDIWTRFREHEALRDSGGGYALHTAWRAIMPDDWKADVIGSVIGCLPTLPEVYAAEEEWVEKHTLSPKGLNVIPGGYAGIRMLHELGLTTAKKLCPIQRDALLEKIEREERAGPCGHYRRGHLRHLPSGQMTWVRACMVAMAAKVVA